MRPFPTLPSQLCGLASRKACTGLMQSALAELDEGLPVNPQVSPAVCSAEEGTAQNMKVIEVILAEEPTERWCVVAC